MQDQIDKIMTKLGSIDEKLDKYHAQTIENKTDIAWLKRGMFGSFFTWFGAIIYTKLGL